jgi:hypothetical protein
VPQILVVAETPDENASEVVYRERIALTDFESAHFSGQFAERVGWAVLDADRLEHRDARTDRDAKAAKSKPLQAA